MKIESHEILMQTTRTVLQQCPVTPGNLRLPLGDQETLVFAPKLYAGTLDFKGSEILDTNLLFIEHSRVYCSVNCSWQSVNMLQILSFCTKLFRILMVLQLVMKIS